MSCDVSLCSGEHGLLGGFFHEMEGDSSQLNATPAFVQRVGEKVVADSRLE